MLVVGEKNIGKQRQENQDMFYIKALTDKITYFVVCDGMGGANGGEIASQIAIDSIRKIIEQKFTFINNVKDLLQEAIDYANNEIYMHASQNEELNGMGTTIVLVYIEGDEAIVAHVGDSRAYLIDDELTLITNDHSMVQDLVSDGKISQEEAKIHPQKNIITRALGINVKVEIDFNLVFMRENDKILTCSDGLTGMVDDNVIFEIARCNDISKAVELLIEKANENGGNDNITVVLAENTKNIENVGDINNG